MEGKLEIKCKLWHGEVKGAGKRLMELKLVNPETQQFSDLKWKSLYGEDRFSVLNQVSLTLPCCSLNEKSLGVRGLISTSETLSKIFSNLGKLGGEAVYCHRFFTRESKHDVVFRMSVRWTVVCRDEEREVCGVQQWCSGTWEWCAQACLCRVCAHTCGVCSEGNGISRCSNARSRGSTNCSFKNTLQTSVPGSAREPVSSPPPAVTPRALVCRVKTSPCFYFAGPFRWV